MCGGDEEDMRHDIEEGEYRAIRSTHPYVINKYVVGTLMPRRRNLLLEYEEGTTISHLRAEMNPRGDPRLLYVAEENLEDWDRLDERDRGDIIDATMDEWDLWANGECFWFRIEKIVHECCDKCGQKLPDEDVEDGLSFGGLIGDQQLDDAIKEYVGDKPIIVEERM